MQVHTETGGSVMFLIIVEAIVIASIVVVYIRKETRA